MGSENIVFNRTASDISCSIQCPKCSKLSALSIYYTQNGVGFRIKNYARHVGSVHSSGSASNESPEQNVLMEQFQSEQRKNESLRKELTGLKRTVAMQNKDAKRMRSANESIDADASHTPFALDDSGFSEGVKNQIENVSKTQKGLKNDNLQLKNDVQNMRNELEAELKKIKTETLPLLIKQTKIRSDEVDSTDEWRQKAEKLQAELKNMKSELRRSQLERCDLLHNVLLLRGKARVMARLRPEYGNQMKFEINSRRTELHGEFNCLLLIDFFYKITC